MYLRNIRPGFVYADDGGHNIGFVERVSVDMYRDGGPDIETVTGWQLVRPHNWAEYCAGQVIFPLFPTRREAIADCAPRWGTAHGADNVQ